jgi:hypothetical protein
MASIKLDFIHSRRLRTATCQRSPNQRRRLVGNQAQTTRPQVTNAVTELTHMVVKLDFDNVDVNQVKLIPAGSIVPLGMAILPGNVPPDNVLTRAQSGDCSGLKVHYTVTEGEHAGQNFQAWYVFEGTARHAESRANTMATFRSIIDAVHGLDPCDKSPTAVRLRTGVDLTFFNGAVFLVEVGIETGRPRPRGVGNFPDRNVIASIPQLGDAEYQRLDLDNDRNPNGPEGIHVWSRTV